MTNLFILGSILLLNCAVLAYFQALVFDRLLLLHRWELLASHRPLHQKALMNLPKLFTHRIGRR